MKLLSTYEVYKDAVGSDPSDRERQIGAQEAVEDYVSTTQVLLKNVGEKPFAGYAATYNGVEYRIEAGKSKLCPLAAVIHFLGNWAATGERRRLEHRHLVARYGYFETIASQDMDLFIQRSQALSQALSLKALPKHVKARLEKMAEHLPQPSDLPHLEVLDPDTQEKLPVSWPLYEPDWEPEESPIPEELKPIYDALAQKLREERAAAEREFVTNFEEQIGTIDDEDDD